jgi:MAF protein
VDFDVASADVDESLLPDENPAEYVLRLAEAKARAIPHPNLVIGSDTAVVDAGEILGKPRDAREAEFMLRRLRGRTHQVYTAIAVWDETSKKMISELSISNVSMRAYGDAEMLSYIETGDPLDKAGAYAIQHPEFQPVEEFEGCFASVMGLPLCTALLPHSLPSLPALVPHRWKSTLSW